MGKLLSHWYWTCRECTRVYPSVYINTFLNNCKPSPPICADCIIHLHDEEGQDLFVYYDPVFEKEETNGRFPKRRR